MANGRRKYLVRVGLAAAVVLGSTVIVSSAASAATVYEYSLTFTNGETRSGTSADDKVTIADAGGASVTDPSGMKVKINCDDKFPGGWGAKEGPKLGIDSAWQVDSYAMTKYKDGSIDKRCSDSDLSSDLPAGDFYDYSLTFVNGTTIEGLSRDDKIKPRNVGGTSVTNPSGMEIKINCDDRFPGGWGAKEGPKVGVDTAWQVESYELAKYKDGKLNKQCSGDDLASPSSAPVNGYVFEFTFVNGLVLTGTSSSNTGFLPGAGGPSVDSPTGMTVHVSCSDPYPGGWGEKDGPKQNIDTAWQVESYSVVKYKDGAISKTCGDSFVPPEPVGVPAVDIEMAVNGLDADLPEGPRVLITTQVTFSYVVTNVGETSLTEVVVVDRDRGSITCPKASLAVGESMDCVSTTEGAAGPIGQKTGRATVTATGPAVAPGVTDPIPASGSGILYSFTFVNGQTVTGSATSNTTFMAGAGGTSVDNPIGMNVHVSCSDPFPGGWGEKNGPVQGVDTAWQLATHQIVKYKDGAIDKTCGDDPVPVPTVVTDSDPVNYFVFGSN